MSQVEELSEAPDPYELIDAMNWSSLKLLHASPKLYQWRRKHPQPERRHFQAGTVTHCAILEPNELERRFDVYPKARNAKHKEYQEWMASHPGVTAVLQADLDAALWIRDSVHSNRDAHRLLTGGRAEETIQWLSPAGLKCKARLDYVRPTGVVEIKTTQDITPRRFYSQSASLLYHGQGAFYHDGATESRAIVADAEYPYTIAIEKEPPYDVGVFQMIPEDLERGQELYRYLLNKYNECTSADWWPGKVPSIERSGLPQWASRGEQEEEFE